MERPLDENALHLLRDLAPHVLGVVAQRYGDFAEAEDAVQEALIAAAQQWPVAGIPSNPRGWLYQVAVRRLSDHIRSDQARRAREEKVAEDRATFAPPPDAELDVERDDTLALLFMCCHPALTPASAIALTLRAVGGLTTAEIAQAFLVPEATMAQRISRAKQAIKASGDGFALPVNAERTERLQAVLHVLYLMFNEGYTSSSGAQLNRIDLSDEAIRLTRALRVVLPEDPEATGLLALMLLTDARRAARTGVHGELIPLDEQDRSRWNMEAIREGVSLLSQALPLQKVGAYQIQAAIAAIHDEAPSSADTDWPQILAFYTLLEHMSDNPMVSLNSAIAVAMVHGATAGLELLDILGADSRMSGHYRLHAVRAHLLEMQGEHTGAREHYRRAAEGTLSIPERNYLVQKALATPRTNG